MDKETNPLNQYVVSYNENDFYCNSLGITVFKDILDVSYSSSYCKYNPPSNHNICTSSTNENDIAKCNVLKEICKNQTNYDILKEIQTSHSVSTSRFQDMNSFYNTEVLKSVNLGIGIMLLSFIIYREI